MTWQRRARWIVAAIGIGCAVAIAWYARRRPEPPRPPVELAKVDPQAALEGGQGQTVIYRKGRSAITLTFTATRRYDDGRGRFEGVRIEGLEQQRFSVKAAVLETSAPVAGSERPQNFSLSGGVVLVTDDGLELHGQSATWDDSTGMLTMPGDVTFSKGRLHGQGVGAVYDRARDAFSFPEKATASVDADATGAGAAQATADRMTLVRGQRTLQLDGNAKIVASSQTLAARAATLSFAEAQESVKYLELRGKANVTPNPGETGDRPAMFADNITMSFYPDGQTLQHATMTGAARLDLAGGASRSVRASWIDVFTAPDGHTVTRLQARDRVVVTLAATATTPGRTITSSTLSATGDDKKGLTSARFEGSPRFEEQPATGQARAGGSAKTGGRNGTATTLVLTLGGQIDAIERAEFQQNAKFTDGDVTAWADVAQYEEASGLLHLLPATREPRRRSRVTTSDMTVDAATIDVDTTTDDLRAQGTVTTRATQAAASGPPGALFSGDEPIIGGADALRFTKSTGTAHYTGSVREPASLIQGLTKVVAEQIDYADSSRNLTASGHVDSTWLLDSQDAEPGQPHVKAYRVQAETLQYDEAARTAVYAGPLVTMTTSDSDVEAGTLTFRLAAESRTLETMRAERAVWTKMSGGYEAVGDILVYQAATEIYTLEGKAGQETARVKSPRSDATGSKTPMCNLNDGMKLELDKKTGALRVPGGGQAPQPVTAIECSTSLRRRK